MRVILDTNVFVSGVFFARPPHDILQAWRDGLVQIVLSQEIFREYRQVAERLARRFPGLDLSPFLELVATEGAFFEAPDLPDRVCEDPDDEKFLACAVASRTRMIISGDRHLLRASGYRGIKVLRPRRFAEQHLETL